ncbi:MAG: pyridoxal-phosphate dependent enzyme [Candidatus Sedimenticola sp. PURPLELP]
MHPYEQLIDGNLDSELNRFSRVHPLLGYLPQGPDCTLYIKREDELSAGVVGTKLRKYLSILPFVEQHGFSRVILIGSANSNNVMGLAQLLKERGVGVEAFVKTPGNPTPRGNLLFLNMLLDKDAIHFVGAREWPQVLDLAGKYARELEEKGESVFVVPEGGDCEAALPGILTLAEDILYAEQELGRRFEEIWIDSGTGVSAIGLIIGLHLLDNAPRCINITLIAGDESEFMARYKKYRLWIEQALPFPLPDLPLKLHFYKPATAASFGSVNKTLLAETRKIACEIGILMDPVYSAKHLYTVKQAMTDHPPVSDQLVIYSGGPLGLCGFQEALGNITDI